MSSTFSIALSALQAQSEAINTTGNDLANLNTTGFKGDTVGFKDLFGETLGANSSFHVGLGVGVPVSDTSFSQGAIQTSTSPYAAAIQGNGFFVVNSPSSQQLFTRDGNFTLDSSGTLKTQTGETVQGWTATSSGLNTTGAPSDIVLPDGAVLPPTASTTLSISANLNAAATVGSATDGTVQTPVQVIDSLGNAHTLTFSFTKTGTNAWNYSVAVPGADVSAGTAGTPYNIPGATGSINFDSSGNVDVRHACSAGEYSRKPHRAFHSGFDGRGRQLEPELEHDGPDYRRQPHHAVRGNLRVFLQSRWFGSRAIERFCHPDRRAADSDLFERAAACGGATGARFDPKSRLSLQRGK